MRRNRIVYEKADSGHWTPYGRVNKVFKDGSVQVIWCTKQVRTYQPDELVVVHNYNGRYDYDYRNGYTDEELLLYTGTTFRPMPRFNRMPTLRRLKQWVRRMGGAYD